jgi:hypothetical protein
VNSGVDAPARGTDAPGIRIGDDRGHPLAEFFDIPLGHNQIIHRIGGVIGQMVNLVGEGGHHRPHGGIRKGATGFQFPIEGKKAG